MVLFQKILFMRHEDITAIVGGAVETNLQLTNHACSLKEILKEKEQKLDLSHHNVKSQIRFVINNYYDHNNDYFSDFLNQQVPAGHEKDYGLEIQHVADRFGASNLLYLTYAIKHTLLTGTRTEVVLKDKQTLEKLEDFFSGIEKALDLFIQRIAVDNTYVVIDKKK